MPFCKFCGKEYPEGSSCDCPAAKAEKAAKSVSENAVSITKKKGEKNTVVIGFLVIAAVLVLSFLGLSSANAKKKPINRFISGINSNDTEKCMSAVYPESKLNEIKDRLGDDFEETMKEADKNLKKSKKDSGIKKYKIKFNGKEKVKGTQLESVSKFASALIGQEVEKAVVYDVELTVKQKGDDLIKTGVVYSVKTDDGWKFLPYGSTLGIDKTFDITDF